MMDTSIYTAIMSYSPNFYTAVRNPQWVDAAHTQIKCEVNFKHVGFEEWTPFTADPTDEMPYSKDIFDRAVAGEFGEVAQEQLLEVVETPIILPESNPNMNGNIPGAIL